MTGVISSTLSTLAVSMTNTKTYEVFDFKELFLQLGGSYRKGDENNDKYEIIKDFIESKFKQTRVDFTAVNFQQPEKKLDLI